MLADHYLHINSYPIFRISQVIEASVLQISRCRSKDFISLIDIRVTFDFAPMGVESFKYDDDDDDDDDDIAGQECLKNNNDLLGEVESEIPLGSAIDMEKEFDIAAINRNKTGDDDDSDCCNDAYFDPQTVKIQNVLTVENIKNPKTREDYRYLHYPTIRLKSIKRALSLCGHTVVGDGGAVKSAKGIFAAVVKVTIFDPDYCEQYRSQRQHENQHHSNQALSGADGDVTTRSKYEPIIISVEDPKKFQKLLGKEQELWERSEDRDQVLISAWNQNQKNEIAVIEDNNIDGSYKGSSVDSDLMDNRFLKAEDTEGFQNDFIRCHLGDSLLDPGSNKTNDYYSSKKETANDRHQSKVKSQFSSLESMRDALSSGMPVEYVLGEARFCGLDFTVDSNVMVPRKSSEILVYQATSFLSNICPPIVRTDSMIKCTADLGSNSGIEIADRGSSSRIALNYIRDQDQHQHQHQHQHQDRDQDQHQHQHQDQDQDRDRDRDRDREGVRVLDIGTGSGCLLLSSMKKYIQEQEQNYQCLHKEHSLLYHEKNFLPFPPFHCNISGVGIDISPEALTVAAANSIKLGLENNAIFKVLDFANLSDLVPTLISTEPDPELTDSNISIEKSNNVVKGKSEISFFEGKTDTDTNADSFPRIKQEAEEHSLGFSGPYDVILCNPPYSSRREKSRLSVACREHEPSLALFSPLGPLAAYRILATSLREAEEKYQLNRIHSKQLNSLCFGLFALDAHIILEVGHGQDVPVRKLFDKLQFLTFVRGEKDHKGIDRCLIYRYLGYDR